ncbi:putative porin [Wenyingzhuangia sp. IMCC45574]
MKKTISIILLFISFQAFFAQELPQQQPTDSVAFKSVELTPIKKKAKRTTPIPLDSIKNSYGARYIDYKKVNYAFDTIQIDTTLDIKNYFRHNFTQKDDFELNAFANQGQTFNKLGYDFIDNEIIPTYGASAKQYNYYGVKDIEYFHVPTPTTILFYNSGFDGQVLNSIFTTNFSKFSNFSVAYKGLRSTGDYQKSRASHTNFRTTYSYYNPDKRYQFRTHFISQKLDNLENGGITEASLQEFKDDNPDISSRGRIDVNLYNSESLLKTDRFYYEHELRILNSKDSLQKNLTNLKLGHQFTFEKSKYQFTSQDIEYFTKNEDFFGEMLLTDTKDKNEISYLTNQVYLKFNSPWILGNFKVFAQTDRVQQEFDETTIVASETEEEESEVVSTLRKRRLNYTSFGGSWNGKYKGIFINGYAQQVINGEHLNSNLHANAGFRLKNNMAAKAGFQLKTVTPNLNTTLNHSNFSNFNWNQNFDHEIYRTIYGSIGTKWFDASLFLHQIENYTYFDAASKASQYNQVIDYLKIRVNSQLQFWKLHFNNSIQYQKVIQGDEALRVPEFLTRNTIYYQDYFFKGKPLLAQIGITFKYFSNYYANDFNPVLNEFYIQNTTRIGGYPTFTAFVNGEVRRTRVYFKIENFTSDYTGRDYFVTRNQPARDFVMRLGVVWNFWN